MSTAPRDPQPFIRVKRLHPEAKLPTRAHTTDAGLDLWMADYEWTEDAVLLGKTGIAVEIPAGHVGLIRERSSVGLKGAFVLGGVIDHGYAGEIVVMLRLAGFVFDKSNLSKPVAQLIIVPCLTLAVVEVDELSQSERGSNGFGSSGR